MTTSGDADLADARAIATRAITTPTAADVPALASLVLVLADELERRRHAAGRPAADPVTEDALLVAEACRVLGVSQTELAVRLELGVANKVMLSRVNWAEGKRRPLPPAVRERLKALVAAAK